MTITKEIAAKIVESPLGNAVKVTPAHLKIAERLVLQLGIKKPQSGFSSSMHFLAGALAFKLAVIAADAGKGYAKDHLTRYVKALKKNRDVFAMFGRNYDKKMTDFMSD